MEASFHGHVDIVRMLTEAKAQVNTQQKVYVHVHVYSSYHHKHTAQHVIILCNSIWSNLHFETRAGVP